MANINWSQHAESVGTIKDKSSQPTQAEIEASSSHPRIDESQSIKGEEFNTITTAMENGDL